MRSVWHIKNETAAVRNPLSGEVKTDTAIIGGGIAGVLLAYRLQRQGIDTVILEADTAGSGTTGNSTGKITAQHGLIYGRLIREFGEAAAAEYAAVNSAAVAEYETIIQKEGIDCDFQRCNAYLYTRGDMAPLRAEVEAAKRLGLDAALADVTKLPFPVKGGLCFFNEARFDPLAFTRGLAAAAEEYGAVIFEKSRVTAVEDMTVRTENGSVQAKHIAFMCHYPFVNTPGYFFLRMSQNRSFALALSGVPPLSGVYLDVEEGGLSLRSARFGEEDVMILSGYDIRNGKNHAGGKYGELLAAARRFWPDCTLLAEWSAEDCRSVDEVPYVGRYSAETPNWYVATGFDKWGFTNAMAAAKRIGDMICGAPLPEQSIFDPGRFKLLPSMKNLASDAGNTVKGLMKEAFSLPEETLATLGRGNAAIVEHEGEKYAVYREENGTVHIISARCPHLGCRLEWNADDKTWECPCHGSVFSVDGEILSGPAVLRPEP